MSDKMVIYFLCMTLSFTNTFPLNVIYINQEGKKETQIKEVEVMTFKSFNELLLKKNQEKEQKKKEELKSFLFDSLIQQKLEEKKVVTFNPYNVRQKSNMTLKKMKYLLQGTDLEGLEETYLRLEEEYSINCLFLLGITILESGWGESQLATTHNNIGGIKNSRGGWSKFDSLESCLEFKAELLAKDYLDLTGCYYKGNSAYAVNYYYCEQNDWAEKIVTIIEGLLNLANRKTIM